MSFSTALSGLQSNSTALDIVGNNLANMNTQGFKASSVLFKDVMGETSGSTPIGAGVAPPTGNKQFTQGSIQNTGGLLDAAIQGSGFFVVKNAAGNTLYTRDGSFKIDANGLLTTSTGQPVQGWSAVNGVLNATGAVGNISLAALSAQAPVPTTKMTLSANLDATTAKDGTFSTPIQVVDSLGATHVLTVKFKNTGPGGWDYDVTIPGEDTASGTAGTPVSIGHGSATFDASGKLKTPAAGTPVALKATGLKDGAADMSIDWSLYDAAGAPTLTQYAQKSAASATTQDGLEASNVTNIGLGDGGAIIASFSNGKQLTIAQLALASVGNPDSLVSVGNNDYQLGAGSMTPTIGLPQTGTRGQIVGGSVEASNVDLAREFTNLIVYQRGYQANSKVITTEDQMSQTLLAIRP
jgi:flagellar hook protein FlgE